MRHSVLQPYIKAGAFLFLAGRLSAGRCPGSLFMSEFIPQLLQQLFNGLSLGAIYALIAIGYTMVYGIIGMINFAHGEIYMIGAYVGLVALSAIGVGSGLPIALIILRC